MNRILWLTARLSGGAAILAILVWRVGTGPFQDGISRIDARSLVAAVGIAFMTTVCCAWRWSLVARGMGLDVSLGPAIGAYYRSQFLNTVLPGGILGDVHRGVSHGRDVGNVGRGVRAVAWERLAGQVVQVVLAIIVLVAIPSSVRSSLPIVVTVVGVGALGCVLLAYVLPKSGPSRWARTLRAASADVREGLLAGRAWIGIALLSAVVVAGHAAMFLIAVRTAGTTAAPVRMLPIALIVMLGMGLPTNIGGWGPREGIAAWAFAAAGLGAAQGVATGVVYGVMAIVAGLPGAGIMAGGWLHRHLRRPAAVSEGVVRG